MKIIVTNHASERFITRVLLLEVDEDKLSYAKKVLESMLILNKSILSLRGSIRIKIEGVDDHIAIGEFNGSTLLIKTVTPIF